MMSEIGAIALRFALVVAILGLGCGIYAGVSRRPQAPGWTRVSERALVTVRNRRYRPDDSTMTLDKINSISCRISEIRNITPAKRFSVVSSDRAVEASTSIKCTRKRSIKIFHDEIEVDRCPVTLEVTGYATLLSRLKFANPKCLTV